MSHDFGEVVVGRRDVAELRICAIAVVRPGICQVMLFLI